jgi:dihydrofolate reductase
MSLDGVIQDPVGMENSGLGNWTGPHSRGPEGDRFKHDELFAADAMIYGRLTYEGFAAVWPTVKDPEGFADRINAMPKYLASKTLKNPTWNNTKLIQGDFVEAVREIKNSTSRDILIYGSASLVHQLMPHRLVDEFRLMVYPTILGRGTRLFPDGVATRLALVETKQLGGGIVLLRYTPNV